MKPFQKFFIKIKINNNIYIYRIQEYPNLLKDFIKNSSKIRHFHLSSTIDKITHIAEIIKKNQKIIENYLEIFRLQDLIDSLPV